MPIGTVIYLPNEAAGPPAQGAPVATATPPDPWGTVANADFFKNELTGLENQLNQLGAYHFNLTQDQLAAMARQGITSMFEFAQQAFQFLPAQDQANQPWLQFGLSHAQFDTTTLGYIDLIQQMTGQKPTPDQIKQALLSSKGQSNPQHWKEQFISDAGNQKAYGWIKYGLSYEEFHTWAAQQSSKFGKELSQEEAVTWLDEERKKQVEPPPGGSKEIQAQPVVAPSQKSGSSQIGQSAIR